MNAAAPDVYKAYGTTFLAWGGAHDLASVRQLHELRIHATGSMWCLTAGPRALHENADLRDAVARDIEGKPIAVPWLFDHVHEGTPSWFGCTNHPTFRAHVRAEVARVMAGGADGLHVDDHLGVAASASYFGGCFCDYCMAAFGEHLKANGTDAMRSAAGVSSFDSFDYRELVRRHATTREQYLKVQHQIPLRDEMANWQLIRAAENVRQLGELASEILGRPVTLSANTGLPVPEHLVVTPYLTHLVGEVDHHVNEGAAGLLDAVLAYRMAEAIGRPLAATASGLDWASIKQRNASNQVKLWIALGHACGQRLMAPNRQWCFTRELGTHWYDAPVDQYAPLYRFVRDNAALFAQTTTVGPLKPPDNLPRSFDRPELRAALKEALERGEPKPLSAGPRAWVFPRRASAGQTIVHVLNLDYDAASDSFAPQDNLVVRLPGDLAGQAARATAFSFDQAAVELPVENDAGGVVIRLPQLRIWTALRLE
jgi:hypothetical protein